jgi:hypothetical protein
VETGVDHIDTSDFYGPHITNGLIREALHPYPDDLVIVTKIGARRGEDASWNPAFSAEALTAAVHGAARRPGRSPAPGAGAPYRGEQRHPDADRGGARDGSYRLRAEPLQSGASGRRRPDRRSGGARHRLRPLFPPWRLHASAVHDPVRGGGAAWRDADAGRAMCSLCWTRSPLNCAASEYRPRAQGFR